MGEELPHVLHAVDGQSVGKGGLGTVVRRDVQRLEAQPCGGQRHGQHAGHGTQRAGEAQLPQKRRVPRQGADLLRRRQYPQQDGQVVDRALLPHPCGSQIHRNAADGELRPAVFHRRPDALAGFLHRRVRQPHHVKPRQPAGEKALHRHLVAGDTRQTQRAHRDHHGHRPLHLNSIALCIVPQKPPGEQPFFQKTPLFFHRRPRLPCHPAHVRPLHRERFCAPC